MAIINLQVSASTDDAHEVGGSVPVLDGISLPVGVDAAGNGVAAGYRFINVMIPRGSPIESAILTLRASATGGLALTRVDGHLHDNSPTFTTTDGDVDGRGHTLANRSWDPSEWIAGTSYASPDIKAVIQDIISRPGWVSGNALTILHIDDDGPINTRIFVESYDSVPANAAKLDIIFTTPVQQPAAFGPNIIRGQRRVVSL